MALTYSQANSVSQMHYDKTLTQQAYDSIPLFVRLKQKNKVVQGLGTGMAWPIRYQQYGDADAVGARDKVVYQVKSTRTLAVDTCKYYLSSSLITWDERADNTGQDKIINLIGDKTQELKEDFDYRLATDIYTANANGNGLTPLATIVDSATTYAGIAVADASNWAATEDGSTTELVLYNASGALANMVASTQFGQLGPDYHLTTRNLAVKFESILEPAKRYEDKAMADAGFRNVTFHGSPVIGDPNCPSGYWYGLCTETLEFVCHPDFNFVLTPWTTGEQMGYPNALIRTLSWAGNLKCTCRKPNFKYTALDYTI